MEVVPYPMRVLKLPNRQKTGIPATPCVGFPRWASGARVLASIPKRYDQSNPRVALPDTIGPKSRWPLRAALL